MKAFLNRFKPTHRGFTIIEVTIVLAIAALIITFIFIAVQNAEKSSRDAARKQAVQQLAGALEQWAQNHNGELPLGPPQGNDISAPPGGSPSGETLDQTSPFCAQNYLPNKCQDFKDPLTNTPYRFQAGSAFIVSNSSSLTCKPAFEDYPGFNHIYPASIDVLYSDSRTYKIDICLESGMYTYQP